MSWVVVILRILLVVGLWSLWACTPHTPIATPTATLGPNSLSSEVYGSIVLVTPADVPYMDVHQEATEALLSLGPGIAYSRLMRLRSGPQVVLPSLAVECDLCTHWEHPDPLTYVFQLRSGVHWHDIPPVYGREVTAQDVVYSLDRMRTMGWPGESLLQSVESVEAIDRLTVIIRLAYPDADFLVALANGQSKVVAPEAVSLRGDLRQGPTIGTGPWVMKEVDGEGFGFEANPRYYESGLPKIQQLRVVPIPDAFTRLAVILGDRADVTNLDIAGWERLQGLQTSIGQGVFLQPGTGILLGLRVAAPPFDRLEVRQALFHALDPWQALDEVWHGQGRVDLGVPSASPNWTLSQEEMSQYLADPRRANTLLAQAGVESSVSFDLTVADFGDRHLALGAQYARMLLEAGFEATVKQVNPRVYAEEVWVNGDFQAFLGPSPPVHTPNGFLFGLLHSQGRWSPTSYIDVELDSKIEEQSVAEEGRWELVTEIQRYVLDKAILFMPVRGTSLWVWQDRVHGFEPNFAASEYFHWARLQVAKK